jgi:Helix-turn-helix domain
MLQAKRGGKLGDRKMPEEDSNRLLCLWQGGMSLRQLANVFGVSPGTIRNELARHGAEDIEREQGRAHASGDHYINGGLGRGAVLRMQDLGIDAAELARRAEVDRYQVDQMEYMVSVGRVWCPPPADYRKIHECLWGEYRAR